MKRYPDHLDIAADEVSAARIRPTEADIAAGMDDTVRWLLPDARGT
jgi:hypothetical protein